MAEFDEEEAGLFSFNDFMKAMSVRPQKNETKRELKAIFKLYNKGKKDYIDISDLRKANISLGQELDEETLKLIIERCDSDNDGRISFEDFYSVMVKDVY